MRNNGKAESSGIAIEYDGASPREELIEGKDFHYIPADPDKLIVIHSQRHIAAFFGVTARTIREWQSQGCPGQPGHYVFAEMMRWKLAKDFGRPICHSCMQPLGRRVTG